MSGRFKPSDEASFSSASEVTVVAGRLCMSPAASAQLGVPNGIEFWRYNLHRAAADPRDYALALSRMANKDLHYLLTMYDNIELVARRHPGLLVPQHLDDRLHEVLDQVRQDIRSEAALRGVMLVTELSTGVTRQ